MKKVLILTTSTGQGHNQAAASVEESFNILVMRLQSLTF